jgi:predicted amidophosphoribosyltransferase
MGYCPSCRHFYSSSRDECPECKVSLVKDKPDHRRPQEKYPTQQITAGRIFFRSGGVVFKV